MDSLSEALGTLVAEQQELSHKAARSTLSLTRLNHRLVIMERYFIALSRRGLSSVEDGEGVVEGDSTESPKEGGEAEEEEEEEEEAGEEMKDKEQGEKADTDVRESESETKSGEEVKEEEKEVSVSK